MHYHGGWFAGANLILGDFRLNPDTIRGQFDPDIPVQSAATPPASWYVDPHFFELEREQVWARRWQPVGTSRQAANAGDYFSGHFMGKPYVVVRGADGVLRAFYNVCRHHGAELVCGAGHTAKFVCPYHGWNYSLTGALTATPRMDGAQCFDKSAHGLKPLAVRETGPFVWLAFGGDSADPGVAFKDAWRRLAQTGYEKLKFHSRRSYDIRCNWKVYVDNYLDGGYHVGMLHRQLSRQLKLADYQVEVGDGYALQCVSGKQSERIGEQALYVWLYPNFMINRYGPAMDTNWVIPLAPDRCLTVFDFYFAETEGGQAQAFIRESLESSEQVQQEDIRISESVQRGLASGAYERGRYAPQVEHAMHAFHRRLARDIFRSD
jgi:choline monooxygenase